MAAEPFQFHCPFLFALLQLASRYTTLLPRKTSRFRLCFLERASGIRLTDLSNTASFCTQIEVQLPHSMFHEAGACPAH
jgi:hypothetical protein